jgi:hypothetical protein
MSDSQEAKQERQRQRVIAQLQSGDPRMITADDLARAQQMGISVSEFIRPGDSIALPDYAAYQNLGFSNASPQETAGLGQFLAANGLSLADYQSQFGGLPFRFNPDGTAVYDPSAQTNAYEYTPASYGRNQMIGLGLMGALTGAGLMGLGQGAGAVAGEAAGAGAVDFASSFAPTVTPSTVAQSGLLYTGGSMPTVAGLTGVGGLTAEGVAALGAMGSAGAGLGTGTTGALGALSLDAAGNIAPAVIAPAVSNLASAGTTLASGTTPAAGAAGAGTAATQATGLSGLLKSLGLDVSPSTLDLAGKLLGTGLSVYASNQQADAAQNIANQYMNMGAPYRAELAKLNADPMSFYSSPMFQGALQQGSDALARSLSAKVGNPILNPTALQEMQNYTTRGSLDAYNQRFNQLSNAGQLGTGQAANLGSIANQAQGQTYNALGAGLQSVFGNQRDYTGELLEILKNRPSTGLASLA